MANKLDNVVEKSMGGVVGDFVVTVFVNGERVNFAGRQATIIDKRLRLPMDGVLEALGFRIFRPPLSPRTISLISPNYELIFVMGSTDLTLVARSHEDEWTIGLDSAPFVENGRQMLPISNAFERMGYRIVLVEAIQTVHITTREYQAKRAEFLVAVDPGHFVATHARRTPQMPDVLQTENGLVLEWDGVNSSLVGNATAPHIITTPDGEKTIVTASGITTPGGWNVSAERPNPSHDFRDHLNRPISGSVNEIERIQMREWEFNNAVAKHLIALLRSRGYSVLNVAPEDDPRMTGEQLPDTPGASEPLNGINNARRVRRANFTGDGQDFNTFGRAADFYISIHANAHGDGVGFTTGNGVETFFQPQNRPTSNISETYAHIVQAHLMTVGTAYGQRHRRVEPLNVAVLNSTTMPAVLTESGFFTNFKEAVLLMDDRYRLRTAQALANAVDEIYELWNISR